MSNIVWSHEVPLPDSVSMTLEGDAIVVRSESMESLTPESEVDAARMAAWRMAQIPYNPDAALLKQARSRGLGAPLTTEFDFTYQERVYRGQGFAMGIVFAEVGHWGEIWTVLW